MNNNGPETDPWGTPDGMMRRIKEETLSFQKNQTGMAISMQKATLLSSELKKRKIIDHPILVTKSIDLNKAQLNEELEFAGSL
ncbi:unnamed protein product [Caenorhabditis nigoni]